MKKTFTLIAVCVLLTAFSNSPSSKIYLDLQKLSSLKKVLYIAAHPDDENTRALAWFSLGEKAETAYLSLTRGDGGQNLIGEELSEDLGVLRTQELLAARSYDGAQQYFSRAVDFGYSKSAEESLDKWGEDLILSDVVLMIRKFQPDVIITRFPPDERAGHGHHTASAMLAIEAFEKAADPEFLPEQVNEFGTWQTTSLYWNASNWWNKDLDKEATNNPDYLVKDIGGYSELLGMSYNEIGTIARSQHKCQGFGAIVERGSRIEYFKHMKGAKLKDDFFERNTRSWGELVNGGFEKKLNRVIAEFNFKHPFKNVQALLEIKKGLEQMPPSTFKSGKLDLCNQVIIDCLGLHAEINSKDYAFVKDEMAEVELSLLNRSPLSVRVKSINGASLNKSLPSNQEVIHNFSINNNYSITNPYWLNEPFTNVFTVDEEHRLMAENDPTFNYPVILLVDGERVEATLPVVYKWRDPSYGERRREAISVPMFTATFEQKSVILQPGQTKTVKVRIHSFEENLKDKIVVNVPQGWELTKNDFDVFIKNKQEEQFITLELTATTNSKRGPLVLTDSEGDTIKSFTEIAYEHIPTQVIFKPSQLECIKIEADINPGKVAYIKGVEDVVPQAIEQLGFDVEVFEVSDLATLELEPYQTVVFGIRIYNVHEELRNYEEKLFKYVEKGGNLIMQYNTVSRSAPNAKYGGPLPFELSRNRVTEEDAEVTFLQPDHPIMYYPNKITKKDFENWVQERGLYFANNWDDAYQPLFSWHDVNEEPQLGALIVANYGEGRFIYTGISFFRELPNGVEGAYRLFANLLSYGKE